MNSDLRERLLGTSRSKRRRRKIRGFIYHILLVVFVAVLLGGFLFSDRFRLDAVSVYGLKRAPRDRVMSVIAGVLAEKKLYIFPENNFFLFTRKPLAASIHESFSVIRDIEIVRKFPKGLDVRITEYDPWGVLCRGTSKECYWIDRDGIAFERAQDFTGVIVPKIIDRRNHEFLLGGTYLSKNFMRLVTFLDERAVSDDTLQSIGFAMDEEDATLRVTTRVGWDILLLEDVDPESAYKNLRIALGGVIKEKARDLEYIDLRFGNKVFYKYKELGNPVEEN